MPVPQIEQLGPRPFSFYPPIVGIEHNEWIFRRGTWSEILVYNTKSHDEIWMPRRFLGDVSEVGEPVLIVGLRKELEFKTGAVWPRERRVIRMPRAVNDSPRPAPSTDVPRPAAVVGIGLESSTESRIGRLIAFVLLVGIIGCFVVITLFRTTTSGERVNYTGVLQSDLDLTAQDDFHAVVRKLGTPGSDRWRNQPGEMQYRRLDYPDKNISIILMGTDEANARYIGAVDKSHRVVHSVRLPGGTDSRDMLRRLKDF
jgi:hypothetical protein